ncbi:MAG: hypothetical protein M0Q13_12675 [Methanothrix sp.]|jgi:hypothetical protein|nr:hypothetical protein [Methanothrix sp.]
MKKADLRYLIPDIAECIKYKGKKHRVTGWLKDYKSKSLENNHDMSEEVFRFLVELYNERKKHECLIGEILF